MMKREHEFNDLIDDGQVNCITRKKREHHLYKNWRLHIKDNLTLPEEIRRTPLVNQWHYIYTAKKGSISLIELGHPYDDDPMFGGYNWQICGSCTPDGDVERFRNKQEAEKRITRLLLPNSRWCFYNEINKK